MVMAREALVAAGLAPLVVPASRGRPEPRPFRASETPPAHTHWI